jgi:hypothetical protein
MGATTSRGGRSRSPRRSPSTGRSGGASGPPRGARSARGTNRRASARGAGRGLEAQGLRPRSVRNEYLGQRSRRAQRSPAADLRSRDPERRARRTSHRDGSRPARPDLTTVTRDLGTRARSGGSQRSLAYSRPLTSGAERDFCCDRARVEDRDLVRGDSRNCAHRFRLRRRRSSAVLEWGVLLPARRELPAAVPSASVSHRLRR